MVQTLHIIGSVQWYCDKGCVDYRAAVGCAGGVYWYGVGRVHKGDEFVFVLEWVLFVLHVQHLQSSVFLCPVCCSAAELLLLLLLSEPCVLELQKLQDFFFPV